MLDEISDDQLLLMFRRGSADAFEVLFDRYHTSVFNFACYMLDGVDGAADVMQEAFLTVASKADQYEPRGRFRAWLMRIVRNLCLNRLRAESARRRVIAEVGLDFLAPAAPQGNPARQAALNEQQEALTRWIKELPVNQREALVLRVFESMKYREIGEALGVPLNTVKTWLHRARATLAERLEEL